MSRQQLLQKKKSHDLFVIIRDLREKNLGIVYISHRMDEIKVITDRVTVMRDGGYVGTLITKDSTKEDIINMMVGRVIYEDPKEAQHGCTRCTGCSESRTSECR